MDEEGEAGWNIESDGPVFAELHCAVLHCRVGCGEGTKRYDRRIKLVLSDQAHGARP